MSKTQATTYGEAPKWSPAKPKLRPGVLLVSWLTTALALFITAIFLPGISLEGAGGALFAALLIAILNALLPPLIAAIRLPFTVVLGLLLALIVNAWVLQLAADLSEQTFEVESFWWALAAALVMSGISVALEVVFGTNDDDLYSLRVIQRIARRSGKRVETDVPGIVYLEIDGLARPILQRAMRDGHAPYLSGWIAGRSHRFTEWETDLSSQTGASQAGILLGSNDDIPAFRWVEKESGRVMTCSAPDDCVEIERRHGKGRGLLADGGASRGNLLSGHADEVILTVSRMEAEKRANRGYQAFLANGFNVSRLFVLFFYEVALEWIAAARGKRRNVQPRGHRGGSYPFLRAAMAVAVRDLVAYCVLSDMMIGRPAVYACFAGYDEVAHHSGLERADTMEVLRKIDQQFGRIERARRFAPRPYHIVVLSDHGQTQGATFKQRNGYGLDELVRQAVGDGAVAGLHGGDENDSAVGKAIDEATGRRPRREKKAKNKVGDERVVVMGSGNLGLIYLMDEPRRMTLEEIGERHPKLIPALREHPHVGWLLVRSGEDGPVALGADGVRYLDDGRVEGIDPLASFSPNAAHHLRRTDGFPHVADIIVNSFYDEQLDEGCAFEELISFHGGMGGPQTRPLLIYPDGFPLPDEPIVGAEALHEVLAGWRTMLQGDGKAPAGRPRSEGG